METKINVAEILKDKPKGTKLYSILSDGECFLNEASEDSIYIDIDNKKRFWCFTVYGSTHSFPNGCVLLFPSKEMRDWSKFAWKRGDVLLNSSGFKLFFDRWANDDYTRFFGKVNLLEDSFSYETEKYTLASKEENLDTLEIEKPEFKDGDIIKMTWDKYSAIVIFWEYSNFGKGLDSHVFFNIKTKIIEYNIHGHTLQDMILRFATEEEKQQLFDALAKKGKAWDAEKKMIVDLKPKYEFKPMDLCLMKYIGKYNNRGWELCQYAYTEHRVSSSGEQRDFYHAVGGEIYAECIPYKGNEHLLGTKKSK